MPKGEPGLYVEYCAKDFLDGTALLDPWAELAYRRVCDMIYATNDRLADDDKKLAWATKAGRRWPAIKIALTSGDKPKLILVDGRITNARCQAALQKAARKMSQKALAGEASAATGKSLENLKQNRTDVRQSVRQPDRTNHLTIEARREKTSLTGGPKGTRLPPDFVMTAEWLDDGAAAREKAKLPPVDLATEAVKFCNHWWAASGQKGVKTKWHATWINWALNANQPRGFNGRYDRNAAAEVAHDHAVGLLGQAGFDYDLRQSRVGAPEAADRSAWDAEELDDGGPAVH